VILSPARRVASFNDLELAGDYTGPHEQEDAKGKRLVVWFLLPVHQGGMAEYAPGNAIHGVYEPPWVFRECADGSLEIRESIGCGFAPDYYWHGYLDEGNTWRQL
jgi:hypothetical protein